MQDSRVDLTEWALALVVVGSVFAIGTVHPLSLFLVGAVALVGGTLAALALGDLPRPALWAFALGLYSAFQALPLPFGLVAKLNPVSAQIWSRCLFPLGEAAPRLIPLSLDPSASIAEGLKWATYAAVFVLATHVRLRRGSTGLAALLFGSAVLVASITLLHGVANLDSLYGVYKPLFRVNRYSLGPLLNSNNLAGYVNLGLFAGVGLSLETSSIRLRRAIYGGITVLLIALLVSTSRGGIVSAVAGGAVIAGWLGRGHQLSRALRRVAEVVAPLAAAVVAAIVFGTARKLDSLTAIDLQRKAAGWVWSLPMIRDHALVGVGRGAFETAFPPYRKILTTDWTAVFAHAENFAIDWIAEWGVPIGLAAVLSFLFYFATEWRDTRQDRLRFCMLTGCGALLLQNQADLGLEIPALAIALTVTLAAAVRPFSATRVGPIEKLPLLVGFTLPIAMLLVGAGWLSRSPVEDERRELSQAYHESNLTEESDRLALRPKLRQAMLRHPGEPYFPLLGSLVAFRGKDPSAVKWLTRAVELGPTNGRVHFVLAQLMHARQAIPQAMLHLRLATEYDGSLHFSTAHYAGLWAPSLEMLRQAIPESHLGDQVLPLACNAAKNVEVRLDCLRYAAKRVPADFNLRADLADALLTAIHDQRSNCVGQATPACILEAEHTAYDLAKEDPTSWRPKYILARTLIAGGDPRRALTLLAASCPADDQSTQCVRDLVNTALSVGSPEEVSSAVDAYVARICGDSSWAPSLDWIANALSAHGNTALALRYYSKAAELDGTALRWLTVADLSTKGHHD
ncbi:MAG TPA: O-antigen ligase family protein, partial [Polyangiaceae bacterium]